MSAVFDWVGANLFMNIARGVTLFCLVMRRTRKHRAALAPTND